MITLFDATYYLGFNTETLCHFDNLVCIVGTYIYFHAMTHIEYLVHLLPVSSRLLLYCAEKWRYGEHVVFYNTLVLNEVHDLGLSSARAVYHAMYPWTHLIE